MALESSPPRECTCCTPRSGSVQDVDCAVSALDRVTYTSATSNNRFIFSCDFVGEIWEWLEHAVLPGGPSYNCSRTRWQAAVPGRPTGLEVPDGPVPWEVSGAACGLGAPPGLPTGAPTGDLPGLPERQTPGSWTPGVPGR